MSTHDSKLVVQRYLRDIVSSGQLDLADDLIAEGVVFVSPYTAKPIHGRTGLRAMLAGIHAAFPDFYLHEEELLGEGDLVASRWVAGGTHTGGDFNGVPPSGRRFEITGMSIYRVRDGRIVEGWVNDDTYLMRAQLGFIPEPAAVG